MANRKKGSEHLNARRSNGMDREGERSGKEQKTDKEEAGSGLLLGRKQKVGVGWKAIYKG